MKKNEIYVEDMYITKMNDITERLETLRTCLTNLLGEDIKENIMTNVLRVEGFATPDDSEITTPDNITYAPKRVRKCMSIHTP
jgi:phage-related baseplate assembly protein